MDRGEGFGEVSLLGEGEGNARHAENFCAEIAVERDERAYGYQTSADGTNRQACYVGQRALAMRGVGQDSDDHPLDQRVHHSADQQSGEERKGRVAARIFRFAHGRQRGLESTVGED